MRVHLRPATHDDVRAIVPVPLPHRIKAIAAEIDGRLVGLGGIGFQPDGNVVAFVFVTDEGRKYPQAIHRAGLMVMRDIRASGIRRVLAEASPEVEASRRWLERLGFRRISDSGGTPVYIWEHADG